MLLNLAKRTCTFPPTSAVTPMTCCSRMGVGTPPCPGPAAPWGPWLPWAAGQNPCGQILGMSTVRQDVGNQDVGNVECSVPDRPGWLGRVWVPLGHLGAPSREPLSWFFTALGPPLLVPPLLPPLWRSSPRFPPLYVSLHPNAHFSLLSP